MRVGLKKPPAVCQAWWGFWRRRPDLNRGMEVLQTGQGADPVAPRQVTIATSGLKWVLSLTLFR